MTDDIPDPISLVPEPTRPGNKVVATVVNRHNYVEFTDHAMDQMTLRNISEEEIIEVLRNPNERGLPADKPHIRIRTGKLNVVYDWMKDRLVVVTTYVEGPKK